MRDSLSAFDQVRAFAGDTIAVDDVVTVLGLVGRDLVLDMLEAVARRGRAGGVCAGRARHRARLRSAAAVPRAGARDPRSADPVGRSVARRGRGHRRRRRARSPEGARRRAASREDLLRAFDVLTKAEQEITRLRSAALQPRDGAAAADAPAQARAARRALIAQAPTGGSGPRVRRAAVLALRRRRARPRAIRRRGARPSPAPSLHRVARWHQPAAPAPAPAAAGAPTSQGSLSRRGQSRQGFFYNTVVAQAYRVDVTPVAHHLHLPAEPERAEAAVRGSAAVARRRGEKVSGEKIPVTVAVADATAVGSAAAPAPSRRRPKRPRPRTSCEQRGAGRSRPCRRCSRSFRSRRRQSKRL